MIYLKDNLDMPGKALLRHLTISCAALGFRWRHYNLRLLGMLLEQPTQAEFSWPFWLLSDSDGTELELVLVWYCRVSSMISPVMCDVRWHQEYGETANLVGVENARDGITNLS
jgi:hypothetical protein